MIKLNRLTLNNFRFFIDDIKNSSFDFNSKNILIYGENGSGKSSIFKAFEFLAKVPTQDISKEFKDSKNIFRLDRDSYIEFEFSSGDTIRLDDTTTKNSNHKFINSFSLINPIIDYKKLLYINFTTNQGYERINLFHMLDKLFEHYPINGSMLFRDIENPNDKLEKLKEIIDTIFDDINLFLSMFSREFKVEKFNYTTDYIPFTKSLGLNNILEFVINIDINFQDKIVTKHHNFLNEARLSSLAISIYFAIIKHLSSLSDNKTLKVLVIDDLLISLDMNNRLNLIDILKSEFNDFQILFFTHDKALFEVYKEKINCKSFEIYTDNSYNFEVPFIKENSDIFTQAIKEKDRYNYGCSANLLRQTVEKIVCDFLPKEYQLDSKCRKILDLEKLLNSAIRFEDSKSDSNPNISTYFKELKSFKRVLMNVASHYSDSNIYKKEINETIEVITKLKIELQK